MKMIEVDLNGERRVRMASVLNGPYVGQCIEWDGVDYRVVGVEPDPEAVAEITDMSRDVAWRLDKDWDPMPLMTTAKTVIAVLRAATPDEVDSWAKRERDEYTADKQKAKARPWWQRG